MSAINFPIQTTSLFVNTLTTPKIIYLPAASTINAGRLYYIKDICGNAAKSTIYISTTGVDRVEKLNHTCGLISINYGAVLMAPDGVSRWYILQHYNLNAGGSSARFSITPTVSLIASTYSGSGTWYDSSPNGFNATIENGTAAKNGAGNGIVLNGSTNWIFNNITSTNVWTLCVWYKNTGSIVGTNPCIVTQIYTGGSPINICLGYGGNTGGLFYTGSRWGQGVNISILYSTWTNYYITWDGTSLITYINGTSQGTTTPGVSDPACTNQYRIGRRWDLADYMVGEIGEVIIFSGTAFSSTQVANDFTYRRGLYGV